MDIYLKVRQYCIIEGHSDRAAARHFGLNRRTIQKMRSNPIPPERKAPTKTSRTPVLSGYEHIINKCLEQNKLCHHKQKMSSKRIYQKLRDEHNFTGSCRTVRRAIEKFRARRKEVYIPLNFPLGTGQADFGEFYAVIAGVHMKLYYFCLSMRNSNKIFVKCYFTEDALAWCDGHVCAFKYFGGIPIIIIYDNSTRLVKKIETNGNRQLATKFAELQSYYLFKTNFARPARGNEKGNVENNIGWIRANILSPTPNFNSIEELNEYILECCNKRANQCSGNKTVTIAEEFAKESEVLRPLPQDNYECCVYQTSFVDKLSTITFSYNHYSVPADYAYQKVTVKAYVDKIIVASNKHVIAEHKRCYNKGQFLCQHQHYYKQLHRKINSFDHAIPLQQADLPKIYKIFLDRLLLTYEGKEAKRYYLEVLELSDEYSVPAVSKAISELLHKNMINVPALKQILLRQHEQKQHRANLSSIKNLPEVKVHSGSLQDYNQQILSIN